MSLIITNTKTLNKKAVVILKQTVGEVTHEVEGDFTVIKDYEGIVGINIDNYLAYFRVPEEGVHTLNKKQREFFAEREWEISEDPWFTIGEIIKREPHPKSEKLFVLTVKTDRELQIVTNSLNSLEGKKVVVANVGSVLPSGLEIKYSSIKGFKSEGMLCGGQTLGKEKTDGVLLVTGVPGQEYTL